MSACEAAGRALSRSHDSDYLLSASRPAGEGVEAEELGVRDRLQEPGGARRSSPRCRCTARAAGSSARGRELAQSASSRARSSELAATPPPTATRCAPVWSSACSSLPISGSTTARWKEAARSARRASTCSGPEVAHGVDERGLQPAEAEVERVGAAHADREVERRGIALAREPVDLGAARESRGPCRRAALSSASPAASSRVEPELPVAVVVLDRREQRVAAAGDQAQERRVDRIRARGSWRRRARAGGRRRRTACARPPPAPWRWTGRPAAPRSGPGGWSRRRPDVPEPVPASASASSTTAFTSSRWCREATSGTTPP